MSQAPSPTTSNSAVESTPTFDELASSHRILQDDSASKWMGIRVLSYEPGRVEIAMELRQEMLNGFGIAHGGMVFAFADTAFALACNPPEDDGTITVAQGVDINFLRQAKQGQTLTARAAMQHQARSGICDIEIFAQGPDDTEAQRIALFRGRCRTIRKPE
ncbi:PaaI family thioesterase [Gulosibacter sp. ACHW.36C]|uniref:Hotdog fold thioesterase n=1 Tax=Gulosibacter sediminis TaxID=1729695 RepID=A0ABY4MTV4_9MICO|nr:hotdog fold thioesterase [Gulosibacter sediminis]UQN13850.1 hotdog fold thioesterase [Gulosibacter sediminis]